MLDMHAFPCEHVCLCVKLSACTSCMSNLVVCIVQGRDQGLNVIGLAASDVVRHCQTVGIGCAPRSDSLTSGHTDMQTTMENRL